MANLTLQDIRKMGKTLKSFLADESPVGTTKLFISPEELGKINGIEESLLMTKVEYGENLAVIVHYQTFGDWSRAVTIPATEFDGEDWGEQYSPVDEAIEHFICF